MTPNCPSSLYLPPLCEFPVCPCPKCHVDRTRVPLRCKYPPCPCMKCQAQREEEANAPPAPPEPPAAPPETKPQCKNPTCACNKKGAGDGDGEKKECDCGPYGCCNTSANFVTFLTEIISIMAFLAVAAVIFWLYIARALVLLVIKIYHSDRKVQFVALAIVALLALSITCRILFGKGKGKTSPPGKFQTCLKQKATRPCGEGKSKLERKNITITITDEKAREIFHQSKLYAIPGEMKQPPALLVYLRDVILRNY